MLTIAPGLFPVEAKYTIAEPPMYTAAMSAYPYSPDFEARYVFRTAFDDVVNMSVRRGNTLLVPRETAPIASQDYRVRYPICAIDCKFSPANDEQLPLAEQSIQYLKEGRNHIFDAPTGWGKTVVGSYIAARLGQPTMIVVTKTDLVDQWHKALVEVLGISTSLVGRVQQDTCDWQGKQFVIGTVQSLIIPDRYPPELYAYFGMVIYDEVHTMAADTFVQACQLFPAYYRLGFSATEKRRDGKSKLLYAHIGPVRVRGTIVPMAPKVLIRNTGWKIPETRRYVDGVYEYTRIPYTPGRMGRITKILAASKTRNAEIVQFTRQSYVADRTVLIMSDLIDNHLHPLFHLIVESGIVGNEIGYYIGGMKKAELESAKKRRIILGTYQMCSTGTDVPRWDTLVLATPRSDVKQSIGRILRFSGGKKQPVILDLVDWDKVFVGFYKARLKTYCEVGAELVKMG